MICLTNDKWERIQVELTALLELEQASIELYCGTISMPQWREAVRQAPEAQRLIELGQEEHHGG